tara:strand:- start:730 stop:969 length:240 start_codon:yes stop_codon:yes gene_type:complete
MIMFKYQRQQYYIMKRFVRIYGFFLIVFSLSLAYTMYRWPYTPEDVINDMEKLGPWGFLIDAFFVFIVYRWWRGRKTQQ